MRGSDADTKPGRAQPRPNLPQKTSRAPRRPQSPWEGRPRPHPHPRGPSAPSRNYTKRPRPAARRQRELGVSPPLSPKAQAPASLFRDPGRSPRSAAATPRAAHPAASGGGERKWACPGLGGPRRHFRPSAAWPRAGSAHAQRPMELPESGPGPRCRGEPAAEAALARLSTQACESGDTKTSKKGPVPRMCPLTER